jgi:hypothetical protein
MEIFYTNRSLHRQDGVVRGKKIIQIGSVANTNEAPPLNLIKSLNSSKLELHSIDWYPLLPLRWSWQRRGRGVVRPKYISVEFWEERTTNDLYLIAVYGYLFYIVECGKLRFAILQLFDFQILQLEHQIAFL